MRSLFDAIGTSAHSTAWLTVLLDAAWKGAILLAAALLLNLLLRRAAAATRHLVWSLALFGLLMLPILSFILPTWSVPVMPQILPSSESFERAPTPSQEFRLPKPPSQKNYRLEASRDKTWAISTNYSRQDARQQQSFSKSNWLVAFSSWRWPMWIFAAWLFGVTLVTLRWVSGSVCVKLLSRRSEEILDDEWYDLAESLSAGLGLQQPVKLLRAKNAAAPMTWGLFHPVILLPNDADAWPAERRRVVLLHELAHVKRGDLMAQCVAQLACALYWFNPLAWIAARQLRMEREQACDDAVLNAGAKASDYANHILEILRALRFQKYSLSSAVAMAQCSQIESRLRAILDPHLRRRALTTKGEILTGAAVACLVLPLAVFNPWARAEKTPAQMAGNRVLSKNQFDPNGAGRMNDPMVIAPWRADSEAAATPPEAAKDCDEKNPAPSGQNLPLDRWVENGANVAGQNLVAAIHSLGIENLPGEHLVGETAAKVGKVLAEKLREAGYDEVSIDELVHRVSEGNEEEYVQDVKKAGYPNLSIEELLELRIYGVDADYIRGMKAAGFDHLSVQELIQLRIQGVDGDYAKEMKAAGFGELGINDLLQLRIQGVDADYAKGMKAAGFTSLSTNDLLQLRIQGVDADYVKELKAVGYDKLTTEQILQMRIQGVDADFVKELQGAGLKNLSPEKLIQLKIHGFDAKFFKE